MKMQQQAEESREVERLGQGAVAPGFLSQLALLRRRRGKYPHSGGQGPEDRSDLGLRVVWWAALLGMEGIRHRLVLRLVL
mmetsp:Transcript_17927/g.45252  ORF Transcript_17927/g.45252 Transcript_17927/m.45252 type:complete len:80 (-) Transcript_17927:115-354(-)